MRVFSYIRYSSANQHGNTTVETQREAIERFASTMPELRGSLIVERRDEGKSATTLRGRDALESILRDAVRDDAVVIFRYDRLGRNLFDSLLTIKALEERGIQVYSTSEPNNEVVRNLLLTMAQEFSRQLGDRCKRALDKRASEGNAANRPPFGYRIERPTPRAGGKFVPVPDEAKIIRGIFNDRANGSSFLDIASALNAEHVRTRRGGVWKRGTVRSIFRNECYLGTTISGIRRFKKGHSLQELRPRSQWSIRENAHEPLVTRETWTKVRGYDGAPQAKRPQLKSNRQAAPWSRFSKCPTCGSKLSRGELRTEGR